MWINRSIFNTIQKTTKSRPVVLITGARQTGKSSLLIKMFPELPYITFDHLRQMDAAKESPAFFLKQHKNHSVIFDEIQYVPELFREIKILVDQDRQNYGKWILTGSQQFELMEKVSDSLAGRISIINLNTLSAKELWDANLPDIEDHLWKGGYPELWSNPNIDTTDFFESYLRTYIEKDLKQIIDVKNLNDFRRFIKILATRTGQLLNYRNLSSDIGVSDVTIKKWIHALEVSGLIVLLPPFFSNIGKRLVKSPKIYFSDHGFACYLMGITDIKIWNAHPYRGNLWEGFVLMELIKNNLLRPGENIFFYRDQNGVEVDFVIEKGSTLYLVEAKASEKIDSKKLNFKKVAPLFKNSHTVESIIAHNVNDSGIFKFKDYSAFNPLNTTFNF